MPSDQIVNPHNPEFITKKPWYLGEDSGPTLDHQQRKDDEGEELTLSRADAVLESQRKRQKEKAQKGIFEKGQWVEALKKGKMPYRISQITNVYAGGQVDLEFEDGTVEKKVKVNANSSKPRVKHTRMGNRAVSSYAQQSYDGKRDAYHGYDAETHNARLSSKYEERESLRRRIREERKASGEKQGDSDDSSDSDDSVHDDGAVFTTRLARQGGVGGAQMKVTARNLRIREDTAKYLRNLDPNSAYYDPKSRSMRDNPNPEVNPEESQFAGDNFTRISGDAVQMADTQLFAWDAVDGGVNIHPQANPSQVELLKKQFRSKESDLKVQTKKAVLEKYGGVEYLDGSDGLAAVVDKTESNVEANALERKIRFGVSTTAEAYGVDGRILTSSKAQPKQALVSRYEEDVLNNGHTAVWGSYFHKGAFKWGYGDDHSLIKASYCTGKNGRVANDEANEMRYGTGKAGSAALAQARGMLKAGPAATLASEWRSSEKSVPVHSQRSKLYGEADPSAQLDNTKVAEALKKAQAKGNDASERKRKYNSIDADADITPEDMEAYRIVREYEEDPMAKLDSGKVLDY